VAFAKGSNDVGAETLAHRRSTSVGRLRRELDGDVGSIVMMAMRKEPEHRYAAATALAADLDAYLDYRPISARARSRSYVFKRYVRRHRLGTAAAAVIAITVIAAALAVTSAWRQTLRQMAQTELQREAAVFRVPARRAYKRLSERASDGRRRRRRSLGRARTARARCRDDRGAVRRR
jgi:hypothetical protein